MRHIETISAIALGPRRVGTTEQLITSYGVATGTVLAITPSAVPGCVAVLFAMDEPAPLPPDDVCGRARACRGDTHCPFFRDCAGGCPHEHGVEEG
jgi:hypothetical protein